MTLLPHHLRALGEDRPVLGGLGLLVFRGLYAPDQLTVLVQANALPFGRPMIVPVTVVTRLIELTAVFALALQAKASSIALGRYGIWPKGDFDVPEGISAKGQAGIGDQLSLGCTVGENLSKVFRRRSSQLDVVCLRIGIPVRREPV